MNTLDLHIEALIFASEQSIALEEIKAICETAFERSLSEQELSTSIANIQAKYSRSDLALELVELADGYLFLTKRNFTPP